VSEELWLIDLVKVSFEAEALGPAGESFISGLIYVPFTIVITAGIGGLSFYLPREGKGPGGNKIRGLNAIF
jgi:hypothetical protein